MLPAGVDESTATAWCARQTLAELRVVTPAPGGSAPGDEPAPWFAAPGGLPDLLPAHLESCLLVAAAEVVDAVVLLERSGHTPPSESTSPDDIAQTGLRRFALFSSSAWRHDGATDTVRPLREDLLVKLIESDGVGHETRDTRLFGERRRGPYVAADPLGPLLKVRIRDAARLSRRPTPSELPTVLVTAPFLARGGAEHTLIETMSVLRDRFRFAIATLAPHRESLGDRRDDFREITERLYCLGDLVHPAAMYGALVALIDSLGAEILYNANSTTLFYDFAPRLKRDRPSVRIIDHLYDHRVGYIDRYTPDLLDSVDACVAENHRIAEVLTTDRGWPSDRVPVIWPCGRARSAFPPLDEWQSVREEIRSEIGLNPEDLVLLAAARMHPQKRPLDLVELASRVKDLEHVQFLMVGGGDLEDEVDAAIAVSGARIRRLPFRIDIPELIVASDVGCLVSEFEGLPVYLLECLQAGRPFIGTDVGDMGDVLRRTGAGIVVDRPGDLDGLEAAVRRLADPDEWTLVAELAAASSDRFDPRHCAQAYAEVFLEGR
jgi:glycosyltransferase involved in cell wall biosynthesis